MSKGTALELDISGTETGFGTFSRTEAQYLICLCLSFLNSNTGVGEVAQYLG